MSEKPDPPDHPGTGAPCPICRTRVGAAYAPFCSKRCADIDLHRWLSGSYAIPAAEIDDDVSDADDSPNK